MVDGPGATQSIDVGRKSARTTDQRDRWALVLGASSGFGAATALALAREGYGIIGVHLDPLSRIATAQAVRQQIAATGVPVQFHNSTPRTP